jgi:hypothetical protein
MRFIKYALTAAASIGLIGPAMAAEMTGAEIKDLIFGNTVYTEPLEGSFTGQAGGQGVLYYTPDGTGLFKTAKGAIWHGNWTIKDNTFCPNWKEAADKSSCSKYDKRGDTIFIINATTGQVRAKILKTAPGNAENLKP